MEDGDEQHSANAIFRAGDGGTDWAIPVYNPGPSARYSERLERGQQYENDEEKNQEGGS